MFEVTRILALIESGDALASEKLLALGAAYQLVRERRSERRPGSRRCTSPALYAWARPVRHAEQAIRLGSQLLAHDLV